MLAAANSANIHAVGGVILINTVRCVTFPKTYQDVTCPEKRVRYARNAVPVRTTGS